MKKKFVFNLVVIIVVIAVIGGATWAWFAYQQSIDDNMFSSGSVEIELSSGEDNYALPFNATGIAPGWSETKSLTVTNTGSLDVFFRLTFVQTGGSADLGEVLNVEVSSNPTGHNYTGKLNNLLVSDIPLSVSGSPITLDITVSMPGEHVKTEGGGNCINDYQDKTYVGKIVVDAVQQMNNNPPVQY